MRHSLRVVGRGSSGQENLWLNVPTMVLDRTLPAISLNIPLLEKTRVCGKASYYKPISHLDLSQFSKSPKFKSDAFCLCCGRFSPVKAGSHLKGTCWKSPRGPANQPGREIIWQKLSVCNNYFTIIFAILGSRKGFELKDIGLVVVVAHLVGCVTRLAAGDISGHIDVSATSTIWAETSTAYTLKLQDI